MRVDRAVLGLLCIHFLGCDFRGPHASGVSVRDSAGVRIVQNERPAWSLEDRWRLAEAPIVEIGVVEGAPEYLFDRIMGAVLLSDGRIVVADMGFSTLRFYDLAGEHLASVGAAGEGPGEFRQIMGIHRMPDDGIAVLDRLERLHVFDSDGRYGETLRIGTMPLSSVDPVTYHENPPSGITVVGWLEDGTWIGWESTALRFSRDRRFDEAQRLELSYSRFAQDGSLLNELVRVAGPTFHPHPMNLALRAVFGQTVLSATDGWNLMLARSEGGEIHSYDPEGQLGRVVHLELPRRPVTPPMIEEYVRRSSPPLSEDIARGRTFAEQLPAFSKLLVDHAGNLWLRHYDVSHGATTRQYVRTFDRESTWSVVDPTGRWLGEITTPAHFSPLDVSDEFVVGLYRGDLDVESIRVYRLVKASDS